VTVIAADTRKHNRAQTLRHQVLCYGKLDIVALNRLEMRPMDIYAVVSSVFAETPSPRLLEQRSLKRLYIGYC